MDNNVTLGDLFLFPFLIGRIRTKRKNKTRADRGKFPFLIGRIRTRNGNTTSF